MAANIAHADGKTEQQRVKGSAEEEVAFSQHLLADLARQGYRLQGTYSPGFGSNNTLVFVKGQ